jgi:hypothetical protein
MGWVLKNPIAHLGPFNKVCMTHTQPNPTHPFTQLFYVCKWSKYFTTSKMIKMPIKMTKIPSNDQ